MDDLTQAVNEHDIDIIMGYCWNNKDYFYVGNGEVSKGWECLATIR